MKKIFMVILISMLTLISAGCGNSTTSSTDSNVIEVGAIFPFTGGMALLGDESYRGVEIAVELRNKQGGVAGKEVSIVKGDAPDANAAQAEANRLVNQENLKLILGSYSSSISLAASEVTERNGAIYWELGAVSDPITNRGYKYVFRTNPPASKFSDTHMDFIKNAVAQKLNKNVEDLKISIVHEDSSYGTTVAEFIKKATETEGLNLISIQPYDAKSNDLTSVLLNIKKDEPDVVIAVSYLNDAILLARQGKELGLKIPVLIGTGGGHTMSDFQEALGADADGVFDVDFPQYLINREFTPGIEDFLKVYKEKYGTEPRSGHSLAHFMGTNVLLDILDQVGEVNPEKIREATLNYRLEPGKSATGWGVEFDPNTGQNLLGQPYVHEWINGKLMAVWPKAAAVEEVQNSTK